MSYVVDTIFRAYDRISAPIRSMQSAVGRFAHSVNAGMQQINKVVDRVGKAMKKTFIGITAAGAAAALAIRSLVMTGADFDRTLVGAAAKFDPAIKRGTDGFERLRMAAEQVGERTEFNAQQGAQALKELAGAGFTVEQAIAALPKVVDLATASEVELGVAAEMATKSLGAFGLKSEDAAQLGLNLARVTDVLATAAGKTEASMEGLFETIKTGAPVAVAAGVSMETFMAMASSLAGAGIEGSEAGTALKNVFLRLSAPVGGARKALKSLGIATKDSSGNLRNVIDVLGEIETATSKLGSANKQEILQKIFGTIPIASVSKLVSLGSASVAAFRDELEKSKGSTETLAAALRDTVAGDIDGLSSAIDGVKIAIFSMNNGAIRDVTQGMTEWVTANKALITSGIEQTARSIAVALPTIAVWGERLGKMGAVILTVVAAVKAWAAATSTLTAVKALMLANPATAWIVGLTALVALVWAFWPEISAFFTELWSGLKEAGAWIWEGLSSAFEKVSAGVVSLVSSVAGWVSSALTPVVGFMRGYLEFVVGFWTLIGRTIVAVFEPVIAAVARAANFVSQVWQPVGAFFSSLWAGIVEVVGIAVTAVAQYFTDLWDGVVEIATFAGEKIVGALQVAFDAVKEVWAPIASFFSDLWTGIKDTFVAVVGPILSVISAAVDKVTSLAGSAANSASNFVSGVQSVGSEVLDTDRQMVTPGERVARSISESSETHSAELTIRDTTGRSQMTGKSGPGVRIRLQPTGSF